MKIEEKLYLLRWKHDKRSHIAIKDQHICLETCGTKWKRPCTTFCPASVYAWDGEKTVG